MSEPSCYLLYVLNCPQSLLSGKPVVKLGWLSFSQQKNITISKSFLDRRFAASIGFARQFLCSFPWPKTGDLLCKSFAQFAAQPLIVWQYLPASSWCASSA